MKTFTVGQVMTLNAKGAEYMNGWFDDRGLIMRAAEGDNVVSHENDTSPYCSLVSLGLTQGNWKRSLECVVSLNQRFVTL